MLFALSGRDDVLNLIDGSRGAIYGSLASIYGSLLGFVITAVSIISVFGDLPRFHILKQSGKLADIFAIFYSVIYCLAIATIAALFGMAADTDAHPLWWFTLASAAIFAVVCAWMWRCIWVLKSMSEISVTPIDQTQSNPG